MSTSPSPSSSPSSSPMDKESAKSILRRAFSTKPTNLPPPQPGAHHHHIHSSFTCIGRGTCGTVWSQPTPPSPALKTSPHITSLQTDFTLTNAVHNAFITTHAILTSTFPTLTTPLVPKCTHFFTSSHRAWWTSIHPLFPPPDAPNPDTSAAMQMHRIPPLPAQVRTGLINVYFHPESRRGASNDPENDDCLVRIYLGATGRGKKWPGSLRNFEMYLDMAIELGLDVELIAEEMAVSLAVIHWEARNDGMDAEWVFGGSPGRDWYSEGECAPIGEEVLDERGYMCQRQKETEKRREDDHLPTTITANDPKRTMPPMYILDFDKARQIELDDSCIPLLLGGVTANDPYFPNPKSSSVELWGGFREAYRVASEVLLRRVGFGGDEGVMGLPGRFLEAWEAWARVRDEDGDEDGDLGFEFVGWGEGDEEDWSDEEDEEHEEDEEDEEDEDEDEDELWSD